jgi:hypothetical protein
MTIKNSRKDAKQIEAQQIGEETLDWSSVKEEQTMSVISDNLRHYGYFYDNKAYVNWVEAWIKEYKDSDTLKKYRKAKIWRTSSTFAGLCKMEINGATLPESCKIFQENEIKNILECSEKDNVKIVEKSVIIRKTPLEHLAEKTEVLLGEVEGSIDDFISGSLSKSYSLYKLLKQKSAAAQSARECVKIIERHRAEILEAISGEDPCLIEAYQHLSKQRKNAHLKFYNEMLTDLEKYIQGKKASRKPRAKKEKPLIKQVERVIYAKESQDYKVTSVNPVQIIGKHELYLFNVKTRVLKYLVSERVDGFWIKGTTVQGFDDKQSFKKKLRKPDDVLSTISKSSKSKAIKYINALSTAASKSDGRINADTIILKVF